MALMMFTVGLGLGGLVLGWRAGGWQGSVASHIGFVAGAVGRPCEDALSTGAVLRPENAVENKPIDPRLPIGTLQSGEQFRRGDLGARRERPDVRSADDVFKIAHVFIFLMDSV
jgi:hypothetical protein